MGGEMMTTFSCAKCPRKFATEKGLIDHLKRLHEPNGNEDHYPGVDEQRD